MPPEMKDKVMHSTLMKEGVVLLMASDMMGSELKTGNSITLMIDCSSEDEIRTLFSKLSEGGNVTHQLKEEFWGGLFGHFVDKYGILWMLNYQKNQAS
jgi:PhnB protein